MTWRFMRMPRGYLPEGNERVLVDSLVVPPRLVEAMTTYLTSLGVRFETDQVRKMWIDGGGMVMRNQVSMAFDLSGLCIEAQAGD